MYVLGLEGTAWAASAAVYETEAESLVMQTRPYTPDAGGIHPREAAEHMSQAIPEVIEGVLAETDADAIDAIAFSRGPGLGPCLRLVATAARTLAQRLDVPLVGVNHMVAHLEIGRHRSGFVEPICLNASGANAHVLGFNDGRYRILGETMDTGIGNAIDKFARHLGWPHPGGPAVEARAIDGAYHPLPYVVKGMDFSFAGITSAAIDAYEDGVAVEDVCCSLQETIFAMLTEVTERALSLTGRNELVLGGGVGQNERLQDMLKVMCEDRNAAFFAPADRLLRDNAGMIAVVGAKMAAVGDTLSIADSSIRADFRPDEVPVTWRASRWLPPRSSGSGPALGAEAIVDIGDEVVVKTRTRKRYRHAALDRRLRRTRTGREARLTNLARRGGVPTPVIRDVDLSEARLTFERVGEVDLRDALTPERVETVGKHLATIHGIGIIHGDPTTRNLRVAPNEPSVVGSDGRVYLIDFGLGYHSDHVEDRAMDLHVFQQSVDGTAEDPTTARQAIERGYIEGAGATDIEPGTVLERLREIEQRGRYQ